MRKFEIKIMKWEYIKAQAEKARDSFKGKTTDLPKTETEKKADEAEKAELLKKQEKLKAKEARLLARFLERSKQPLKKAIGPLTEQEVSLAFQYLTSLKNSLREFFPNNNVKIIPEELKNDLKLLEKLRNIPGKYRAYLSPSCIDFNPDKNRFTVTFTSDINGDIPIETKVTHKQMLALANAQKLKKQPQHEEKKPEPTIDQLKKVYSTDPSDNGQRLQFRDALLVFKDDKELIKLVFEAQPTTSLEYWINETIPKPLENQATTEGHSFYSDCKKLIDTILETRKEFEDATLPTANHKALAIKYIKANAHKDNMKINSNDLNKEANGNYSVEAESLLAVVNVKMDKEKVTKIKAESASEKLTYIPKQIIEFAKLQASLDAKNTLQGKINTVLTTPVFSTTPTLKPK